MNPVEPSERETNELEQALDMVLTRPKLFTSYLEDNFGLPPILRIEGIRLEPSRGNLCVVPGIVGYVYDHGSCWLIFFHEIERNLASAPHGQLCNVLMGWLRELGY